MLGIKVHKNIKQLYYAKNALLLLIPRWFFQNRLHRMILSGPDDDIDYLNKRVNYYNKLNDISLLPKKVKSLNELRRGKKHTTYFFDSYEVTRYFNPKLHVNFEFGDITKVAKIPSLVKSRPIEGNNENSVLLKLNKVRHFIFVNDTNPFNSKKNILIGRGGVSDRKPKRIAFYKQYFDHPLCDLGQTNKNSKYHFWYKKKISIEKHLKHKFILCLEGIDVSSNLKWVMSSNSIAVMTKPQFETWFMEGQLLPDYHYIQIKDDYSDLEDKLKYYIENPEKCMRIIQNANAHVEQFKDKRREKLISLMVLKKYFLKTRQNI
jgi:hypothetical protein